MTFLYILLALFVFGVLVMLHELGHFLIARLFGVGIREFSIGMGPKLLSWKGKKRWGEPKLEAEEEKPLLQSTSLEEKESEDVVSEGPKELPPVSFDEEEPEDYRTRYSLRLLPIGGYVSMVGEDEESEHPAAFGQKNVFKRISIVIAGAFMNILLGFLLMILLVTTTKTVNGDMALASTAVAGFDEGATSNQWLQQGDVITHVNGTRTHTGDEVIYEIMHEGYQPLNITVERGGEEILLVGVIFPGMEVEGISFGSVDFVVYREDAGFGTVMKHSFFRSCSMVKMIFDSLGDLLTGRFGLESVSGPVGVTETMGDAAANGFHSFLYVVILLTINLGVFNLLPIPALDGGRLLFLLIEAIIGRPVNPKVEGYIHLAGLLLLLGIMVMVTCKDVVGLFV